MSIFEKIKGISPMLSIVIFILATACIHVSLQLESNASNKTLKQALLITGQVLYLTSYLCNTDRQKLADKEQTIQPALPEPFSGTIITTTPFEEVPTLQCAINPNDINYTLEYRRHPIVDVNAIPI